MSTIFIIVNEGIEVNTDEHGSILNKLKSDDYVEVAFRASSIYFKYPINKLSHVIRDEQPVYPLDNTAQGIFTIGDIKKEIQEQDAKRLSKSEDNSRHF